MQREHSIKRSVCFAIKSMTQIYGMRTRIFIPTGDNSIYSGADDGSLIYPVEPTYVKRSVVIDLFGDRARSFDLINTLFEDNNMAYFECGTPDLPVNTLLVVENDHTLMVSAYKISALKEYRYKSINVMNTYEVMPYNIKLGSQMEEAINIGNEVLDELEDIGFIDNNQMGDTGDSITDNIDTVKVDDALAVKDVDKPLRKRSVNTFTLE